MHDQNFLKIVIEEMLNPLSVKGEGEYLIIPRPLFETSIYPEQLKIIS